ncbi:MAG: DUF6259 domain-containing protein [Eubacteriales bacterium]|nr:DUF6259 domain-containing protein [Eubacteriales bacterium]
MILKTKNGYINISDTTGSIIEINRGGKKHSSDDSVAVPLFQLRLMDEGGGFLTADSFAARKISISGGGKDPATLLFEDFENLPGLSLEAEICAFYDKDSIEWGMRFFNNTHYYIENIDYPCVQVPRDLGGDKETNGSGSSIFWPKSEGCIISDISRVDRSKVDGSSNKALRASLSNMYPGMVTMQFMAYYGGGKGLYFAAHDTGGVPKLIQCYSEKEGIRLSFRAFCCVPPKDKTGDETGDGSVSHKTGDGSVSCLGNNKVASAGANETQNRPLSHDKVASAGANETQNRPLSHHQASTHHDLGYKMVTRFFEGDWMDAASIYREFVETSGFDLPPKVVFNNDLPGWHGESPIVVIYPPRSIRGTGYLGPNEFFPYKNALKYIDDLAEAFDSKILVLLTYWEGSAPWAPPYIWPPYGGEDDFKDFVKVMHDRGHYVGVYGSGLHWTDKSLLVPEFDMGKFRLEKGLNSSMCAAPDEELFQGVCETIRTGHNMCVACKPTCDIAMEQFAGILSSGVDFIQYFDQNMGGRPYICYSNTHGHPKAFGAWSTAGINKLYDRMAEMIRETGRQSVIGCESAPADCFIKGLPFNDLRYYLAAGSTKFVPAFSFVFHEYSVNFMGNQAGFSTRQFPHKDNPDSLAFCIAYSFIAGNLLTAVIKSGGEIHWEWGMSWLEPGPRQKDPVRLFRNLNAMRTGAGKNYLHFGRMEKPACVYVKSEEGFTPIKESFALRRADGSEISYTPVLYSKWVAPNGTCAQIFANFLSEPVTIYLEGKVIRTFDQTGSEAGMTFENGMTGIVIPPFGSVGAELS